MIFVTGAVLAYLGIRRARMYKATHCSHIFAYVDQIDPDCDPACKFCGKLSSELSKEVLADIDKMTPEELGVSTEPEPENSKLSRNIRRHIIQRAKRKKLKKPNVPSIAGAAKKKRK